MEKKSSVTMMSNQIQPESANGSDVTQPFTMHQSGAVHHLARAQSWDPYEVWLNRVHRPRAERGVRDALNAQAPAIRDASGLSANPLTIVQTLPR